MATTLLVVKNRAYSKLAAAITAAATSLTVTAGEGANFPSTYPFHLTIEDEIVSCTNRSTDTLTIARAQQGTTGATHANKSYVALFITAKSMTDLNTAVNTIEDAYIHKDGSVAFTGAQAFGANGAGVDATFYGVTSGQRVLWDASANKMSFVGGADLTVQSPGYSDFQGNVGVGGSLIVNGNTTVQYIGMNNMVCAGNATFSGSDVGIAGTLTVITAINNGYDASGGAVNFYADTTGCGVFFDPTGDGNKGVLSVGASGGSKGTDFYLYGTTNGQYIIWDASTNKLSFVGGADLTVQSDGYADFQASVGIGGSLTVIGNTTVGYIGASSLVVSGNTSFLGSDVGVTGTLTVIGAINNGYDDAGCDVTFYGDTSGSVMFWDASDDRLEFTNAREAITITGAATGKIGHTVSTTQAVGHTGWALGYFGSTTLSATSGSANNAAGGVFEVNMASGFAAAQAGLVVGAYVGAYSNQAGRQPTAGLWVETIAGSGVSFQASGTATDMPMLALVTSGAGTKSSLAIEFGSDAAGKTVTTTSGGMFYNQTIQVKANGTLMYIPLSTAEGSFIAGTQTTPLLLPAEGYGFELHYAGNDYSVTALRARAQLKTTDTTATAQGAVLQAANNDGINAGCLNGALIEAIGKSTTTAATISTMRGLLVGSEWGAFDTITDLRTLHVRTHTLNNATIGYFATSGYLVYLENEAVGGNGQALTAGIYFKETNIGGGGAGYVLGIDFSGASYTTGVIKFPNDALITCDDTTLTLPAFTLGGTIKGNTQAITGIGHLTLADNYYIRQASSSGGLILYGGTPTAGKGANIYLYGADSGGNGLVYIQTPDAATTGNITRLRLSGNLDTAVATWANITHTGLVLSGALDLAGNYASFTEMSAPGAGAANTARVYAVVGGDTLTDLAAVFQDGTVDIFAQEATDPNSPIFQYPDDTKLELTMRKPDRKTIQFVATYPDGREFVMRELRYPTERW